MSMRSWMRDVLTRPSSTRPVRPLRSSRVPVLEQLERRELLSNMVIEPLENTARTAPLEPAGRPTGFLKRAEAIDGTTIRIDFNKQISRQQATNLDYDIAGL